MKISNLKFFDVFKFFYNFFPIFAAKSADILPFFAHQSKIKTKFHRNFIVAPTFLSWIPCPDESKQMRHLFRQFFLNSVYFSHYSYYLPDKSKYNQIANYTYLDTQTNISIGEKAPNEYFRTVFEQCVSKEMKFGMKKKSLV